MPKESSQDSASSSGSATRSPLRRTGQSGGIAAGARPLSLFGQTGNTEAAPASYNIASQGNEDNEEEAGIIPFSTNVTPRLNSGTRHTSSAPASRSGSILRSTVTSPQKQRNVITPVAEESNRLASSSKTITPLAIDAEQPAPALPDELLEALAKSPRVVAGQQLHFPSPLPSIVPTSPLTGEDFWGSSAGRTPTSGSSSPLQSVSGLRRKTQSGSYQWLGLPETPKIIPPTPSPPVSGLPSPAPSSNRNSIKALRKTASAESLRSRSGASQGLGIEYRKEATEQASSQAWPTMPYSEIKSIWKGLSFRLPKGKERAEQKGGTSAVKVASPELGRRSLSLNPKKSLERRLSTASNASARSVRQAPIISQPHRSPPRSSLSERLHSDTTTLRKTQGASSSYRTPAMLELAEPEAEDDHMPWLDRENFVQDLTQRRTLGQKSAKPSTISLKRAASWAQRQAELEAEAEDDGDTASERSEIASMSSFIDPREEDGQAHNGHQANASSRPQAPHSFPPLPPLPSSPSGTAIPGHLESPRPRSVSESFILTPLASSMWNTNAAESPRNMHSYGNLPRSEVPIKVRSRKGSSSKSIRQRGNADFVIAIVGQREVGKSTIIESNLKLSKSNATIMQETENGKVVSYVGDFSVLGSTRTIEILEVDTNVLEISKDGLKWPANLPSPDGAMLCFKHGDPKAIGELTTLLNGFWTRGGIALIALATHCTPATATSQRAAVDKTAEICNIHGAGLVHLDGGIEDPNRKAKNSLQWILRKIIDSRGSSTAKGPASPTRTKRNRQDCQTPIPEGEQLASGMHTNAQATEEPAEVEKPKFSQMDIYLSREDILQKFIYAVVTGNDDQHVQSFLIIFRRFARPFDVVQLIVERFMRLESYLDTDPLLTRFAQMKLCNALAYWLERHPGDFSGPSTRAVLRAFIDQLLTANWVHHYAMELLAAVEKTRQMDDPEKAWALPDPVEMPDLAIYGFNNNQRRPSLVPSFVSTVSSAASSSTKVSNQPSTPATPTMSNDRYSFTLSPDSNPAAASGSLPARPRAYSDANTTASSDLPASTRSTHSVSSQRMSHKHSLLIDASNLVMETPVSRLAQQITKLAWDTFSAMQPRDLLRYVMMPRDPDNPAEPPQRSSADPVGRSIALANYLSNWVATLIMVQSRAKMRIRVTEHFIRLAEALRKLDNYDCLMAILLGLNCQPVHRLKELANNIPVDLMKRFQSMNVLMSTSRAFAAYRLAISTARPEFIPYLGVHLQDITRLQDGKSDMKDGLVNWSKMRQIARHCAIVSDCSRVAIEYLHDDNLSRLVTDLPVYSLDSDSLYDLSYAYKPRQARNASNNAVQTQTGKFKKLIDSLSPQ